MRAGGTSLELSLRALAAFLVATTTTVACTPTEAARPQAAAVDAKDAGAAHAILAKAQPIAPSNGAASNGAASTVHFRVTALPDGEYDVPRSRVAIVLRRTGAPEESVALGSFSGDCTNGKDHVEKGELARIDCWWAGQGDTFIVARRGDALVVLRRELDSQGPDLKPKQIARLAAPHGLFVEGAEPELP